MRVILYARCSTADQSENGVTLDAQLHKLNAYAALFDLEVVASITDAGESAKSLNRPGLQRALAMLRSGEADGLAVVKLDRLTRSVADWQTLIDQHFGEKAGKQLMSVGDSIDTRSAAGRLVLNMLLSVAQWERETTGERTREALRHKIRCGERVGKVKYGFTLAADGQTLVANEVEAAAISLMASLRSEGVSFRAIATALTERGIPAKESGTWDHSTVRRILSRELAA